MFVFRCNSSNSSNSLTCEKKLVGAGALPVAFLVQFLSKINQYATTLLQQTGTEGQVHQKSPKLGDTWRLQST